MSGTKPEKPPGSSEMTLAFLRRTFREHYFRHHDYIEMPEKVESREFGYTLFGRGMIRHLSYKTSGELAADLVKQGPSSVYCSNATYSNPTLAMDEKGWKGAELIFDIDASAIPTACQARHSFWACKDCGKIARSAEGPGTCQKCGGTSLAHLPWSCPECLAATKDHVARLISFLTEDFGVANTDIAVYFSGNRGYHLHVGDTRFESMQPEARAEVANYVRGTGLIRPQRTDDSANGGWLARMASAQHGDQPPKMADLAGAFGSRIDESVTTDIHRIFRMPGTLHGSSGLLKAHVHDLAAFRPDYDPVVLGDDEVSVWVQGSPAFSLKGKTFGPFSGEEAELPTYAAVYLMTKGLGRVEG